MSRPVCRQVGAALLAVALGLPAAGDAQAEEVRITEQMPVFTVTIAGQEITIARNADPQATLQGEFARTSRACPPFCIQPMRAVRTVAPVGELEVMAFLRDRVAAGSGVLIDARLPEWFAKGSIPGAVNVPFATLDPQNPFRNDILAALGGKPTGGDSFDFSGAMEVVLFCNGAWSDQSVQALRFLRDAGYPADKIFHYRGGMQDWQLLGLTVAAGAGN